MTAQAQRRRERTGLPASGAVRLHIVHLVLHGVAPVEAGRLARALEEELATLAAQPGLQFAPMTAGSLLAARIGAGRAPEQIGRAVASAVWSGATTTGRGGQSR
jgi:hypothetical protein